MSKYFSYSFLVFIFVAISYLHSSNWQDYERAVNYFKHAEFDSVIIFAGKIEKSDSLYFYSRLLTGHALLELDRLDQARDTLESLLPFQQNRFYIYNGLGLYYLYHYQKSRGVSRVLKKLFSSDELNKSVELFNRAIRLNPDYLDARLNRNRAFIVSGESDNLFEAEQSLELLANNYPANTEILFYLGKSQKEMGDIFGAISTYEHVLELNPGHSEANLALAFIYFHKGEFDLFSGHYMQALPELYDQHTVRELSRDIMDILTRQESNYAANHRLTGDFFKQFWQNRDPVKITSQNERLVEHYRRLEYARANYPGNNQAGYDDRGKIYVKYGPPDDYSRFSTADGNILENESWVYVIDGETYNFDFVNEQTGYSLRNDLSSAVVNPDPRSSLTYLRDLYSRRAHLSNYYASIYQELFRLQPRGNTDYITEISGVLTTVNSRERVKRNQLPVAIYNLNIKGTDLPFEYDQFRFFNPDSSAWFVDVIYRLQLNELNFKFRENKFRTNLIQKLMILSSDPQKKPGISEKIIGIVSRGSSPDSYFANKMTSRLFPGKNQLNFQLKTEDSEKFRIIESTLNTPSAKDNLLASDIQLSDSVRIRRQNDNPNFCWNNFYIRPLPGRNFNREKPIFCYFEVYNIALDKNGTGRCLIETKIKDHKTGKNLSSLLDFINPFKGTGAGKSAIAITNEFQFTESYEPVVLAFDISHIEQGIYELVMTATDRNSGQSISENKLFYIY
jgi:GWxTD domain-containing protein